jgi:hypothetical protein
MKTAGLLLPLILATTLLAAEPSTTPVPAEPAAAPAPTPVPATQAVPLPAPSANETVAKPAAADPAAKLSPEVSQMLTANLPKYAPPAPAKPAVEASPDAIELPKMIVKQKRRPRLGDEVMMTNKAFNEKLAKEKTSSFDRDFLNKYGFLGGSSAAERAREEYDLAQRDQMIQDVSVLAKAVEQEDPAAAKALRDAANKP